MNTKDMAREQISALADGEVSDAELDALLAKLRHPGAQQDWAVYHRIGDVLRSDDMAFELSPGFSARMSAALDKEPTVLAPAAAKPAAAPFQKSRRWALTGIAAAAVAAVSFVATPQLMVAMKGDTSVPAVPVAAVAPAAVTAAASEPVVVKASASEGEVMRDARMDDYLLAHQRLAPSFYSTAQYARSATFANDSNK
ncbi:histidine kinase [Oxalobacteraceae bacterium OM1]|nr:histidine kinase [Oxalobacteraceae bacterium OM1]